MPDATASLIEAIGCSSSTVSSRSHNFTAVSSRRGVSRSTLTRASQRIVRSLVGWGILRDADTRGQFTSGAKVKTNSKALQLWFLEASHCAGGAEALESQQLISLPTSFPFEITVRLADLRRSKRFAVHRQGLDMEMVSVGLGGDAETTEVP